MASENAEKQRDEVEALASIFGVDFCTEDKANHVYSIRISDNTDSPVNSVTLEVTMPPEYPSGAPPIYQLIAPWLRGEDRMELSNELENIYLDNVGESVIFLWADKVKDFIIEKSAQSEDYDAEEASNIEAEIEEAMHYHKIPSFVKHEASTTHECPIIHSGEIVTDRKSVFQGHIAAVHHPDQVKQVMGKLLENKKIAAATHNIQAYRILRDADKKLYYSGSEDDGEFGAGGRMLHLLDIIDADNVLVVVTRWYGGVHLGPDRFKHINNITRQLLLQHGYIKEKEGKKGPKSKKH